MDKCRGKVKEAAVAKDDPEREARLAQALRENLRRRKAQAREGAGQASPKADAAARTSPPPRSP